nr:unnamed protein product [Mus musculus]
MYDCIAAASYLYCGTHASVSQSPHLTSAAEAFISWVVSATVIPYLEYLNVPGIEHCSLFEGDQFWFSLPNGAVYLLIVSFDLRLEDLITASHFLLLIRISQGNFKNFGPRQIKSVCRE